MPWRWNSRAERVVWVSPQEEEFDYGRLDEPEEPEQPPEKPPGPTIAPGLPGQLVTVPETGELYNVRPRLDPIYGGEVGQDVTSLGKPAGPTRSEEWGAYQEALGRHIRDTGELPTPQQDASLRWQYGVPGAAKEAQVGTPTLTGAAKGQASRDELRAFLGREPTEEELAMNA